MLKDLIVNRVAATLAKEKLGKHKIMPSQIIDRNPDCIFLLPGCPIEQLVYRFNVENFLTPDKLIDPNKYFVTSGCLYQKTMYLASIYAEMQHEQMKAAKKLFRLAKRCKGRYVFMESEWWDGQLYIMLKNPRSMPRNLNPRPDQEKRRLSAVKSNAKIKAKKEAKKQLERDGVSSVD